MSDLLLTAANVRALREHGAIVIPGEAGAAMNIGDTVTPSSDGAWDPTDANVSAALARNQGVVVESYDGETAIAAGAAISVCVLGPVSGYADLVHGANYYISDNAGKIADAVGAYDRSIGYGLKIAGVVCLFVFPQQNDPAS